jgi:hypothetical protein
MFQYDGKPRKKSSSVFASTRANPIALASTGATSQAGWATKPPAQRKKTGTIT